MSERTSHPHLPWHDRPFLGANARSIMSCPEGFEVVVDGLPLHDPGILHGVSSTGIIRFLTRPDSELAAVARRGMAGLVYVDSALHQLPDSALAIVGELDYIGEVADAECPSEPYFVVDLVPTRVMLLGPSEGVPMTLEHRRSEIEVPLDDFRSRRHELNAGYLQRAAEHANACHQEDLRRTVAQSLGRDIQEIGGVEIHHIDHQSASVDWLDSSGATRLMLRFVRPARTPDELAGLLIEQLRNMTDTVRPQAS